jgi:hypothetical protein
MQYDSKSMRGQGDVAEELLDYFTKKESQKISSGISEPYEWRVFLHQRCCSSALQVLGLMSDILVSFSRSWHTLRRERGAKTNAAVGWVAGLGDVGGDLSSLAAAVLALSFSYGSGPIFVFCIERIFDGSGLVA